MAFPTLGAQQETNRKILEDLQIKRQLLQKGVNPVADINLSTGLTTPINQLHYGTKLEEYLSGVDGFEKPKIKFEQYPTPPHIASCVLYNVQAQFEDLEGKLVGDLGCGCGMLSIGSFLLGAQLTVGFELDLDAIDVFRNNVSEMELPAIDCVQANVLQLPGTKWDNCFDTIVTNPPFGTKNNVGMDMRFVETGIHLATEAVYSLHKTSTRDYVKKKSKDWNVKGQVVAELKYNIEASYKFHKNKSVDIEVDFWRFDVTEKEV